MQSLNIHCLSVHVYDFCRLMEQLADVNIVNVQLTIGMLIFYDALHCSLCIFCSMYITPDFSSYFVYIYFVDCK